MQHGGIGAARRAPASVLRRMTLGKRIAARAASRRRLADAAVQRRSPKLLRASTRLSPPTELHPLVSSGASRPSLGFLRATRAWSPAPTTPDQRYAESGAAAAPTQNTSSPAVQGTEATVESPFKAMLQQNYGIPDDVFEAMFGSRAGGSGEPAPPAPPPVDDPANEPPQQRRAIRGARILEGPTSASDPLAPPAHTQGKRLSPRQPGRATTPSPRPTVDDAAIASAPAIQDQTTPAARTAVSSEPTSAGVGPSTAHGELRGSAPAPPTGMPADAPPTGMPGEASPTAPPVEITPAASVAAQRAALRTAARPPADPAGRDEAASSATPKASPTTATPPDRETGVPPSAAAHSAPAATTPPGPATTPPAPGTRGSAPASETTPGSAPSPPPVNRGSASSAPAASVQGGSRGAPARPLLRRERGGTPTVRADRPRVQRAARPPSISAPPTPSRARGSRPARTFARRVADAVRRGRGRSEPAAELPAIGVGSSSDAVPQRPAATSAIALARRPSISTARDPRPLGDQPAPPPSSAPAAEVEEPAAERSSAPRSAPSTVTDPGPPARMRLSRVERGSAVRPAGMPTTRTAAEPPPAGESSFVAGSAGEHAQPAGGAGVPVVPAATGGAPTATPTRAAPAEPGSTPPAGLGDTHPGVSDAGPRPTRPPGATTGDAAAPSRAAEAGSAQPGPAAGTPRPRPSVKRRARAEPMPAVPLARDSALQRDQHVAPLRRPPESATPARLGAVATPARRSDGSAAPTSQKERPVATLARRSVGEPSPADIRRQTATAVARDDIGRGGRSRPDQLLRRIADTLSGRRPEGTPPPAAPAIGRTSQSAPHEPVPTATPVPGRLAGPIPAPSPRPLVALAPRPQPRAERPPARRPAPSSESWRSRGADAGLAGPGAAGPAGDGSAGPPVALAPHVAPPHDVPLTIARPPAPAARHDSSPDSEARAAALRSLTRAAAVPPPRSPSQAPPPVRPSRSRLLARAPATGADQRGGGGGGGSGGGGGGGGQDSDLIYTEVMRRVRQEQEQLGQLIDHPF